MSYVDGFVLSVPTKNLKEYKKMAAKAGKLWKEYGALQYVESVADDLIGNEFCSTFTDLVKPKKDETILFSFITFKSRKHRDSVNKKVMADPKLMNDSKKCDEIFDVKRMSYGGFKAIVEI